MIRKIGLKFKRTVSILIRIKALRELGEELAGSGERERAKRVWSEVEAMIQTLEEKETKSEAMKALAITFIHAQEWRRAENLANALSENKTKIEILQEISKILYEKHENEYLLYFVQRAWLKANTRTETLQMVSLSMELISLEPKLGIALFNGFTWVDTFLNEEIEKYM